LCTHFALQSTQTTLLKTGLLQYHLMCLLLNDVSRTINVTWKLVIGPYGII